MTILEQIVEVKKEEVKNLKRDFMPKGERERLSIEPHNFTTILDSLDQLRGVFTGLRSKIDKRPSPDTTPELTQVSTDIGRITASIRTKMDMLEEAHTALRRYHER